jgi:hypothetical protein
MNTFSIPGIHKNDIEFYTKHTGCVKIKNATQYSAGNYSCSVEIRTNNFKFVGSETIEELVPFSAGNLSSNNATHNYVTDVTDSLKDHLSNIWISIYFPFILIITFIRYM